MKIYAILSEHIDAGFIWLQKDGIPTRGIVKVTNPKTGQSVYCEALQMEKNFLRKYNCKASPRIEIKEPKLSIVMSGWYRARLGGLKTQCDYPLEITGTKPFCGKIRACMHHPQVVVRVAVWLGILSVLLGTASVLLCVYQ